MRQCIKQLHRENGPSNTIQLFHAEMPNWVPLFDVVRYVASTTKWLPKERDMSELTIWYGHVGSSECVKHAEHKLKNMTMKWIPWCWGVGTRACMTNMVVEN